MLIFNFNIVIIYSTCTDTFFEMKEGQIRMKRFNYVIKDEIGFMQDLQECWQKRPENFRAQLL